jgi:uncharacterized protein YsxB (DUF464 family)
MIQVRFEKSEDGKTIILTLKGHSEQAEMGQDIVCSAASILAYTVAQVVTDMGESGKLKKKPHIRLESGDATITCKPTKQCFGEAMHTYIVAQTGYELLAHTYKDYVRVIKFGEA